MIVITRIVTVLRRSSRALAGALAAPLLLAALAATAAPPAAAGEVDPRWLAKLDAQDRALLAELVGKAPPAPTAELTWIGMEPLSWSAARGRVVVLHSWTTANAAGRSWPRRLAALRERLDSPPDLVIVALHTPQGAENAKIFLERRPPEVPAVIDPDGAFCNALGIYKEPVSIVVDRQGAVRYVGLNEEGLEAAVGALLAEPFDPDRPAPAPAEVAEAEPAVGYPPANIPVRNARDMRGQRAPELFAAHWLNGQPAVSGKVAVIDFWATWCAPCVASIPHMNELAEQLGDKVAIIGISDESPQKFQEGMQRLAGKGLTLNKFRYAVALDPEARMKKTAEVQGIPHVLVISRDGIVRWQGHPGQLTAETLQQIVAADASSGGGAGARRNRW